MSKPGLRTRMASLSFSEKIRILEKLRDREKSRLLKGALIAIGGAAKVGMISKGIFQSNPQQKSSGL